MRPFFASCLFLVSVWIIEGVVRIAAGGRASAFLDDKFQLQINTTTTIITFLLVALLQNSQSRDDLATQHKLNAIADGLADFMERTSERFDDEELRNDIVELRLAVGLEVREGSQHGTDFRPSPSRRPDEPEIPPESGAMNSKRQPSACAGPRAAGHADDPRRTADARRGALHG